MASPASHGHPIQQQQPEKGCCAHEYNAQIPSRSEVPDRVFPQLNCYLPTFGSPHPVPSTMKRCGADGSFHRAMRLLFGAASRLFLYYLPGYTVDYMDQSSTETDFMTDPYHKRLSIIFAATMVAYHPHGGHRRLPAKRQVCWGLSGTARRNGYQKGTRGRLPELLQNKKSAILNTAQDPSNDACSHAREGASQPDMLLLRTDKAIEDRSGRLMSCTLCSPYRYRAHREHYTTC